MLSRIWCKRLRRCAEVGLNDMRRYDKKLNRTDRCDPSGDSCKNRITACGRFYNGKSAVMSVVAALLLIITVLLTSAELLTVTFGDAWFRYEFSKYSVLENVRGELDMDEACDVMSDIMDYMFGDSDSLDIEYVRDGDRVQFLSDDAAEHLKDCREITDKLKVVRIVCVIGFLVCAAMCKRKQNRESEHTCGTIDAGLRLRFNLRFRGLGYAVIVIGVLAFAVWAAAGGSFDAAFIGFHKLFFDNDLWLIDPEVDDLINLLPVGFFRDTVTAVGWMTGAGTIMIWTLVCKWDFR